MQYTEGDRWRGHLAKIMRPQISFKEERQCQVHFMDVRHDLSR